MAPLWKTFMYTLKLSGTWSHVAWKRAPNHQNVGQSVRHLLSATMKIGSLTTVTSVYVLLANRLAFNMFHLDRPCGHCLSERCSSIAGFFYQSVYLLIQNGFFYLFKGGGGGLLLLIRHRQHLTDVIWSESEFLLGVWQAPFWMWSPLSRGMSWQRRS